MSYWRVSTLLKVTTTSWTQPQQSWSKIKLQSFCYTFGSSSMESLLWASASKFCRNDSINLLALSLLPIDSWTHLRSSTFSPTSSLLLGISITTWTILNSATTLSSLASRSTQLLTKHLDQAMHCICSFLYSLVRLAQWWDGPFLTSTKGFINSSKTRNSLFHVKYLTHGIGQSQTREIKLTIFSRSMQRLTSSKTVKQ